MAIKTGKKTASRMWFSFLALFAVWIFFTYLISILVSIFKPEWYLIPGASWVINDIPLYLLAMPIMLLITNSLPNVEEIPRQKMKMGFFKFVFIFLFVLGLMYAANIFTMLAAKPFLMFIFGRTASSGAAIGEISAQSSLLQNIFFGAVVPALGEEFIFRYWLRNKTKGSGDKIFIAISAVSFGLFHGNIDQAIYAMAIGAIIAWVYVRTDNIVYPILLHFIVNMFGLVVMPFLLASFGVVANMLIVLFMLGVILMAIIVFFVQIGKARRELMPPAQAGWTKDTLTMPDPALARPSVCEPPRTESAIPPSATGLATAAPKLNAVDILISLSSFAKSKAAAEAATPVVTPPQQAEQPANNSFAATRSPSPAYAQNPYAPQTAYRQPYPQNPAYAQNPYAPQTAYGQPYPQNPAYAQNPYAPQTAYGQPYPQNPAYAQNPYAPQTAYGQPYPQNPAYAQNPYAPQTAYGQPYPQNPAYAQNPYAPQTAYGQPYPQNPAYAQNPYAPQTAYRQPYPQNPAYAQNPYAPQMAHWQPYPHPAYAQNPYAPQMPRGPLTKAQKKERRALKKAQAAARGSLKIAFWNPGAITYIIVVSAWIIFTLFLTTSPI